MKKITRSDGTLRMLLRMTWKLYRRQMILTLVVTLLGQTAEFLTGTYMLGFTVNALREQRPVRHQTDAKAQLPRAGEDLRELRVQQRLAQNVQIQIVRPRPQLPREEPKLLCREHPPRPPRPGAEGTREIAAVRNFQIDTAEHPAAPFHIFLNCYCTIPGGGNTRPGRMGAKNQDPRPDRGS